MKTSEWIIGGNETKQTIKYDLGGIKIYFQSGFGYVEKLKQR